MNWVSRRMSEAIVVLAAGVGSRFRGHERKLRTDFRGRPILEWVLEATIDVPCDERIVVVGGTYVSDLVSDAFTVLENVDFETGMASSLKVARSYCEAQGHAAMTVGLADQPGVTTECWTNVVLSRGKPIAVATYNGQRRNPVRLARSVWFDLPNEGDLGARSLMAAHPEIVEEVACKGECFDIDTVEDLLKWS